MWRRDNLCGEVHTTAVLTCLTVLFCHYKNVKVNDKNVKVNFQVFKLNNFSQIYLKYVAFKVNLSYFILNYILYWKKIIGVSYKISVLSTVDSTSYAIE